MTRKLAKHIILLLPLFLQLEVQAQRFFAGSKGFGLLLGGSNYHGDLAREIVLSETHAMLGAYYESNYNAWFSMRYQLSYGKISGSDKNFPVYENRNLSFFSNILEGAALAEFNFLPFGLNPNLGSFSPYVFTGLAMFYFEPKTRYNKETISLRDMKTEGKRYSLLQPSIPLGFGIKFERNRNTVVGIEVGFRKTWTDYLDDVKGEYLPYDKMLADQGVLSAGLAHRYKEAGADYTVSPGAMRGDPHLNDWYFFMNLRIGYKFGAAPCADHNSF